MADEEFRNITWLASYPKSGNTWVRAFLATYYFSTEGPIELNQMSRISRSDSRFESYVKLSGKSREELTEREIDALRYAVQLELARAIPSHCVVKTHNARVMHSGYPLVCKEFIRAVVYLVRNPLDIADSYADHANLTMNEAIRLMNSRGHRLGGPHSALVTQHVDSWSGHVQSWIDRQDFPPLVIRYEDLKRSPVVEFEKLIRFLGWEFNADRLESAIAWTDFKVLRQLESETGFEERSHLSKSGRFFRRGESGTWKQTLTFPQIESLIGNHHAAMEACGYRLATGG